MKYKVSKRFYRKEQKHWVRVDFVMILALFFSAYFDLVSWSDAFIVILLMLAASVYLIYVEERNYNSMKNVFVEIKDSFLIQESRSQETKVDLTKIYKVRIEKKGDQIVSIVIEVEKGYMVDISYYENLDALFEEMLVYIQGDKIKYKRKLVFL